MLSQLEVSGSHITDAFLNCHCADQLAAPQEVVLHLKKKSGEDDRSKLIVGDKIQMDQIPLIPKYT